MNKKPIREFYKKGIPLYTRGVGLFSLGDKVEWKVGGGKGRIVEIVKYGMYPLPGKGLRVRGYFRDYESYIVEDEKGKRYWPRVGNLTKVEKEV